MTGSQSTKIAEAFRELQAFEKKAEALVRDPKSDHIDSGVISSLKDAGLQADEIRIVLFPQSKTSSLDDVGPTLDLDESGRAYRLTRIVLLANRIFGDSTKAFLWLRMNNATLGGRTPIASLESETGSRLVEELLIRIDHGIAA